MPSELEGIWYLKKGQSGDINQHRTLLKKTRFPKKCPVRKQHFQRGLAGCQMSQGLNAHAAQAVPDNLSHFLDHKIPKPAVLIKGG